MLCVSKGQVRVMGATCARHASVRGGAGARRGMEGVRRGMEGVRRGGGRVFARIIIRGYVKDRLVVRGRKGGLFSHLADPAQQVQC
jgi:hypothetical protein